MNTEIICQGKTKIIRNDPENQGRVIVTSKNMVTAQNGKQSHEIASKDMVANLTTCAVFQYLKSAGVACAFEHGNDETSFSASYCKMIPIEIVVRRVATGSYVKRHLDVADGTRFCEPLVEFFLKDDAQDDPQLSENEIFERGLIQWRDLEKMRVEAKNIFLLLEHAWQCKDVVLVDLKLEFGWHKTQLVLADVVDNDSWRLWPQGLKSLMVDKQNYRDVSAHTDSTLSEILKKYNWVMAQTQSFLAPIPHKVVIFMGSESDLPFAQKIRSHLEKFDAISEGIILSAHKSTAALLNKVTELEQMGIPLVYIAVAGRSNALGPVLEGNTVYPVINCPPIDDKFSGFDILSSLQMPSGMGCSTVLSAEGAALCAIKYLAMRDPFLFGKFRGFRVGLAGQYPQSARLESAKCLPTH